MLLKQEKPEMDDLLRKSFGNIKEKFNNFKKILLTLAKPSQNKFAFFLFQNISEHFFILRKKLAFLNGAAGGGGRPPPHL